MLCISGQPLVTEPAGFVKKQSLINIRYHSLLIDTEIALMSSLPLGGSFAHLLGGATNRKKNQCTQYYS